MSLLDPDDVRNLLTSEIPAGLLDDDQLDVAMRLVAGWLRDASGRTDVDALLDEDPLFAPALELLVLVLDNPTSKYQRMAGPTSAMWPQAPRRDAILDRVRKRFRGGPQGGFPPAESYPDPALRGADWYDPATRTIWVRW